MDFEPTLFERSVAGVFRCYPLVNGCGTVANSRIAKALLPYSDRTVWASVGGRRCLVPLNDLVGRAIFLVGELDRKVGITVDRLVRQGDVVLDVGANLGLVTLQMANRGASRILSFEPSPIVLNFLEKTITVNSDAPIELHRVALGREDGNLPLAIPESNAGRATLRVDHYPHANQSTVSVVRLAEVLEQGGIQTVHFMKLDVEGFEAEVLEGLFCGPVRPERILFEEHDIENSRARRLMSEEGYVIKGLSALRHFWLAEIPEGAPRFSQCHDFIAERR